MKIKLPSGHVALIDSCDFDRVSCFRWHLKSDGFVVCRYFRGKRVCVYLHRFILGASRGVEVDHVNHDRLDNRRKNLRLCSRLENSRNQVKQKRRGGCTSRYKGVSRWTDRFWKAEIRIRESRVIRSHKIHIGSFSSEKDAALARDLFEYRNYGKFSNLNFPSATIAQRKAAYSRRRMRGKEKQ
jgi:hypothetical protein